jgi:hypothetical protein
VKDRRDKYVVDVFGVGGAPHSGLPPTQQIFSQAAHFCDIPSALAQDYANVKNTFLTEDNPCFIYIQHHFGMLFMRFTDSWIKPLALWPFHVRQETNLAI